MEDKKQENILNKFAMCCK